MIISNRAKEYRFTESEMTAAGDESIDVYSKYPLYGNLQAIQWIGGNHTATGSIIVSISGTGETLWALTSGLNNVSETFTKLPRGSCVTANNTSLGSNVGNVYDYIPLRNMIKVEGAGLGSCTSGLGLNIAYM